MIASDELDARKSIAQLYAEWKDCVKCELGQRRDRIGTKMTRGFGRHRAILLVGDAPREVEEGMGIPLLDAHGDMLNSMLKNLGIEKATYMTYAVACRSCRQKEDEQGQPRLREHGGFLVPDWEECPPPKPCVAACKPRLAQEIYIVDPVVIVAMGTTAIEALFGKAISVKRQGGQIEAETISVQGVGFVPCLTEKRGQWVRSYSITDGFVLPTAPVAVDYTMIPTYNHHYVGERYMDESDEGPFNTLHNALRLAAEIYERCMLETHGYVPQAMEDTDVDY